MDDVWVRSKPKKLFKMQGFPPKWLHFEPECKGRYDGADGGAPGAQRAELGPTIAILGGLEKFDFLPPWWDPIIMGPWSPWVLREGGWRNRLPKYPGALRTHNYASAGTTFRMVPGGFPRGDLWAAREVSQGAPDQFWDDFWDGSQPNKWFEMTALWSTCENMATGAAQSSEAREAF